MGIDNYYFESGSGKKLILLHGNNENHEYFVHQIKYFSKKYHVIAIDSRGHGKTPRGKGDFSISRFADDLKDFFDDHAIEKANILGFSDGGNVAMLFALRYPKLVDKLILNGANLYSSGIKEVFQLPVVIGYHLLSPFKRFSDKIKKSYEMLSLMVKDPALKPKQIRNIKAPTLVIVGTNDMIKTKHTRLIAESIPNSKLVFVKGDHFIANNNFRIFNREVEIFLNQYK